MFDKWLHFVPLSHFPVNGARQGFECQSFFFFFFDLMVNVFLPFTPFTIVGKVKFLIISRKPERYIRKLLKIKSKLILIPFTSFIEYVLFSFSFL